MSEDKRHEASHHKLSEARKRGEIAYSKDLTGAAGFVCGLVAAWATSWRSHLDVLMTLAVKPVPAGSPVYLLDRTLEMMAQGIWLAAPALVAAAVGGLVMAMIQARGVFSVDPIKFKLDKLNPAEGFKKMFSARQLVELLKMVLKMAMLLGVLVWVIRTGVSPLLGSFYAPAAEVGSPTIKLLLLLFWCAAIVLVLFGLIDFGHQYFEYMKQNRMNDEERKREFRDMDGDPHVKAELRAQRKALLQAPVNPRRGVKEASVVLTNPTHYAVALFYEEGVVELPVLVAKGADDEAFELRREAQRLGIPIMENPPLTRSLFKSVGLEEYVGEGHIEAVAEVFRWLNALKQAGRG